MYIFLKKVFFSFFLLDAFEAVGGQFFRFFLHILEKSKFQAVIKKKKKKGFSTNEEVKYNQIKYM